MEMRFVSREYLEYKICNPRTFEISEKQSGMGITYHVWNKDEIPTYLNRFKENIGANVLVAGQPLTAQAQLLVYHEAGEPMYENGGVKVYNKKKKRQATYSLSQVILDPRQEIK
jgi:hypothetical protein